MKVIEHIDKAHRPFFSFEIVPPPRGRSAKEIVEIAEKLSVLNPPWIDVTSHASSAFYHEGPDGVIKKKTLKKRPGTLGICGIIQNRFKIDTVAHILCLGFSKQETEDALIELNFLGIENILALQGDHPNYEKKLPPERSANIFAKDLVNQVVKLRSGEYVDETSVSDPLDFCIGVAGYPEKHFESPNFKTDIQFLKQKVEAGADYIVSQMFFDNQKFFDYVSACREAGIKVPIIPGLKIIRSLSQIKTLPKTFHIDLPEPLVDEIMAHPKHVSEIGFRWAQKQAEGLLNAGYPGVHFYIMNDTDTICQLVKNLQGKI